MLGHEGMVQKVGLHRNVALDRPKGSDPMHGLLKKKTPITELVSSESDI